LALEEVSLFAMLWCLVFSLQIETDGFPWPQVKLMFGWLISSNWR
jgi:hypothetical protein